MTAAHDEFAERGYAKAQMARIAQRAGIAVGSVYNSFQSKRELLVEVYRTENIITARIKPGWPATKV